MKLKRLIDDDEGDKKNKTLTLKIEEKELDCDDEEMKLVVPDFRKFMKCKKQQEEQNNKGISSFTLICFQCGEKRNIRPYSP